MCVVFMLMHMSVSTCEHICTCSRMSTFTCMCVLACEGPELILEFSLNRSSPYIEVESLSWTQNSPMPCEELLGGYGHGLTRCMVMWRVTGEMLTRRWARKLFTLRQGEHIQSRAGFWAPIWGVCRRFRSCTRSQSDVPSGAFQLRDSGILSPCITDLRRKASALRDSGAVWL